MPAASTQIPETSPVRQLAEQQVGCHSIKSLSTVQSILHHIEAIWVKLCLDLVAVVGTNWRLADRG